MMPINYVSSSVKTNFTGDDDTEMNGTTVPAMSRTTQRMKELGVDMTAIEVDPELQNYKPQITIDQYIQQYKECETKEQYEELHKTIVNEENMYRRLYAKKTCLKNVDYLNNKEFFMIPAYDNEDIFKSQSVSCLDNEVPIAFPVKKHRDSSSLSISTKSDFDRNWRIFSERLLDIVNWDNVFVAGGSILACVLPVPTGADKNFKTLRKYFHEDVYSGSDIDLFIYGLNEEQATEKLKEIYEAVCNEIPYNVIAFRSAYAISIVSQFPYRHIQIILRLYSSPAEILMGFDVDSCAIGFDGKQVYMMPRCHQALVRQRNTIDLTRRSPTYELRLAKYAERGFEIEVPQLIRDKVDPMIFERPWAELNGLAKLLVLETLKTPEARYAYKERSMNKHVEMSWKRERMMQDPYIQKRLEFSSDKTSDYSTVFLPWGPNWNAKKIRKLMLTKDIVLNADWSELFTERGYHTHPCFVGTLEEVIKDQCGCCPEIPSTVDKETLECFVHGPISFIVDDPGRQSIGSFHPITEGDWTEGAFMSEHSEIISLTANKGDVEEMKKLIEEQHLNVNTKDCLGRTPLQIALLSKKPEMVKYLISQDADITVLLSDTRNLLHLATQYGYLDILDLLLTANKENKKNNKPCIDINAITKSSCLSPYHNCILYGHLDCLKRLCEEEDIDMNTMVWNKDHSTGLPLFSLAAHVECFNPSVANDITDFLLEKNISIKTINTNMKNIYHFLACFNYPAFTKHLLEKCSDSESIINDLDDSSSSPLCIALNSKNYAIAKLFLDHKARFCIIQSDLDKLLQISKHLKSHYYGNTTLDNIRQPIAYLASNITPQSIELVKRYIEEGNNINIYSYSQTFLDMVNGYQKKTKKELIEDMKEDTDKLKETIEYYKNKLESVDENSWEYMFFKNYYTTQYDSYKQKYSYYFSDEEVKEYNKFHDYLVAHGAKTYTELTTGKAPDTNKCTSSFGGTSFGFGTCSPFGQPAFGQPAFGMDSVGVAKKMSSRCKKGKNGIATATEEESIEHLEPIYYTSAGTFENCFSFQTFESTNYGYRQFTQVPMNMIPLYIKFYRACWNNDIDTVKALATPSKDKKQCVLVTSLDSCSRSPFSIAVSRHNTPLLLVLFNLLQEQYTPITQVVDSAGSEKVSNYKLIDSINNFSTVPTSLTSDTNETGFVDPNADFTQILNTIAIKCVFEHDLCFLSDLIPEKVQEAFNNNNRQGYMFGSQQVNNDITPKNYFGSFKYTHLKDIPDCEYTADKTTNCSLLTAILSVFNKDEVDLILKKICSIFNLCFEKEIKANIHKESDRNNCDCNDLYSIVRDPSCTNQSNNGYSYYNRNTLSLITIICLMDKADIIPVCMKYLFCGLEFETKQINDVEMKTDNDNDNTNHRVSTGVEIQEEEDEEEKEDDEEEEEKDDEEDDEEEKEEDEEEDEEEYHYVDSDEEELAQLQAFRKEKKETTVSPKNITTPLSLCCRYNAINCLKYFLNKTAVTKDIESFLNENEFKLHSCIKDVKSEDLYLGCFNLSNSIPDLRSLYMLCIYNKSYESLQYFTEHITDYSLSLSQLYTYKVPEVKNKKNKNNYYRVSAFGTLPVYHNPTDSILQAAVHSSYDIFVYIFTHYQWSNEDITSVMSDAYSTSLDLNSFKILKYLIDGALAKKDYASLLPLIEKAASEGFYGFINYLIEQGYPSTELSGLSKSLVFKIATMICPETLKVLDNYCEQYVDSNINRENEQGLVPLDIICKNIQQTILSNSSMNIFGTPLDNGEQYYNSHFGAFYPKDYNMNQHRGKAPRKRNMRGSSIQVNNSTTEEGNNEDYDMYTTFEDKKENVACSQNKRSIVDLYNYVAKRQATVPRELTTYEEVKKQTEKTAKDTNNQFGRRGRGLGRMNNYDDDDDY